MQSQKDVPISTSKWVTIAADVLIAFTPLMAAISAALALMYFR